MPIANRLPVLSAIIIIVAGMFIFNFSGFVFGILNPENSNQLESSKINDKLISKQIIEDEINEKPFSKNTEPEIIHDKTQKEKDPIIKDELSEVMTLLEREKFYLEGLGEAWISSKNSFTPVEINASILPVKGTKLTKFDLIDAKILVGGNSLNFNKGTVQIEKTQFTLNIISDVENSIFFSVIGNIDYKIKDSVYSGNIIFDKESFYIYEPGKGQFHLTDYEMKISSQP